jgi:hypothetical protein
MTSISALFTAMALLLGSSGAQPAAPGSANPNDAAKLRADKLNLGALEKWLAEFQRLLDGGELTKAEAAPTAGGAAGAGSQTAAGQALARTNQPSLVLSLLGDLQNEDGFLTMGEIIDNLDFSAELVAVTAGAATPASGEASEDEGLAGLARSMLYAGARKLLLSQWKVEPLTTRSLVTDTFLRLRKGVSAMAAVEESRARIRAGTIKLGDGTYSQAHPYFWASFVLMGD